MQLRIPLIDLYAAPGFLDPIEEAASLLDAGRVAALYSFLPSDTSFTLTDDTLVITRPDPGSKRITEASALIERATKRAREGDHEKAIEQYERGLAIDVLHTTARRDLAMARMAKGDTVGTDAELRRLLLLAPADAWAWVVLGNLNFRQNFALAERYFRRAVELSPNDPYAWNGMGAMYTEKHDYPKAVAAFESALSANPKFANAYFGLAMALAESGEPRRAFETLERMFQSGLVPDTRSIPTFERAGRVYRDLAKRLASETMEAAEAEVESLAREAEGVSGFPVKFEDGDFGVEMTASGEMAWKHGRDHHVIRVRPSLEPAVKLHARAHELCHIIMEAEARDAGRNRWFSTNDAGARLARQEIANEVGPITRSMPAETAQGFIERLIRGLMAQLYNLPLDMVIERRIATRHRGLRFAQIHALSLLIEEAVKGCSSPDIVRLVPRRILHASRFLNACYAAFVDRQFGGALGAGGPFMEMGAMERGMKLLGLWDERTRGMAPGKEYDLVDAFATELRLQDWFEWVNDPGGPAPVHSPEGASDPELLATKSPAAVFYFLDILKRFDAMGVEAIKQVAADAAVAGRDGLNYGSPDKSYRVIAYGPPRVPWHVFRLDRNFASSISRLQTLDCGV